MADPTPTPADYRAANDLVRHTDWCAAPDGAACVCRHAERLEPVARALATAREAGQDVEVGRRRGLIDRARAESDAAGYARGRAESAERIAVLESLLQEARATLARVQAALEAHPIAAAEARGRAEGLREAAGLARRVFGHADLHGLRDEMVRAIDRALTLTPPPMPESTQPCCGCDSAEEPADCECSDYCPHDGPCQCDCHRGPTPASGCLTCGDSGSVPTGAYDETEERDERVACPACDGDGGDAPEPTPGPRSCNRHTDCDAADRDAKARGKPLGADHCHDETCEECFGH